MNAHHWGPHDELLCGAYRYALNDLWPSSPLHLYPWCKWHSRDHLGPQQIQNPTSEWWSSIVLYFIVFHTHLHFPKQKFRGVSKLPRAPHCNPHQNIFPSVSESWGLVGFYGTKLRDWKEMCTLHHHQPSRSLALLNLGLPESLCR